MSSVLYKTNQDIPQDMLLGNMIFMSLADMTIAENDLINIFNNNNIPSAFVRKISKADAFRRATSYAKNKIIYVSDISTGASIKAKIEVDEVKSDEYGIKRIIGFKSINQKNEDISYTPIGSVLFDRDTEQISYAIEPIYSNQQDIVDIFDTINNNYSSWSVYHNKDTVKNIINRIIISTNPVNLMPTGLCKFVPSNSTNLMYSLKGALAEMNTFKNANSDSNIMEIIPVIDTEEQRNIVEKNFTAEITNELFDFTQVLKDTITNKNEISTKTAHAYIEKFRILKEKAEEYGNLLGIYIGSIKTQIENALTLVADNSDLDEDEVDIGTWA